MTFLFGVNVAGFEFTPSFVQHYNTAIKPFHSLMQARK
jgi:hypothetical protein